MQCRQLSLALLFLASNSFVHPCRSQDDATSPTETIKKWARAFTAKDAAAVISFYEESDQLIAIASSGQQTKGFPSVKKEWEKLFRDVVFTEHEVTELAVVQNQDVAWATCRQRGTFRNRADNTRWQMEVRTTLVLKRHKNGWKIVVDHSSPIAGIPRMKPLQPEEKKPRP